MAVSTKTPTNAAFVAKRDISSSTGRITNITSPLTLANGMTAGYGDQDGHNVNPPAQKGTYGGNPLWQPKRVGVLRNITSTLKKQYSLYFIFNPNQINISFSINTSILPANYTFGANNDNPSPVPAAVTGQVVQWNLLFDRTYDMLYGDHPEKNRGTLRDVAALYNILDTFDNSGVPSTVPVEVIFGRTETGQIWGFTGWITNISIVHGIFRYNMIPSRTEVDITMTAIYVSDQAPADDGSGGSGGGSGGGGGKQKPLKNVTTQSGLTLLEKGQGLQYQGAPVTPTTSQGRSGR